MTVTRSYPELWQLAELVELESGMLERQLPSRLWVAQGDIQLDADADRLLYRNSEGSHPIQDTGAGVLSEFVTLADAEPERILRYARKWGVLMLCEHDLPCTHNPPYAMIGFQGANRPRCGPRPINPEALIDSERYYREPLGSWRRFARQARAILNVAAALRYGSQPKEQDWDIALGNEWKGAPKGSPFFIDQRWWSPASLAHVINEWLRIGDVQPRMTWCPGKVANIELGTAPQVQSPFGAIALHLAFAVARADGLVICSACGQAYTTDRKPRAGERRYCDECRERGVPARDAARDYRARKRQQSSPEGIEHHFLPAQKRDIST